GTPSSPSSQQELALSEGAQSLLEADRKAAPPRGQGCLGFADSLAPGDLYTLTIPQERDCDPTLPIIRAILASALVTTEMEGPEAPRKAMVVDSQLDRVSPFRHRSV